MKIYLLVFLLICTEAKPQSGTINTPARITFMLRNTLGYHRMFLVEGPGIKYGFTMSRRETIPCNWPVGSKLYFTQDGETSTGLILTVTANDEGKTLVTDTGAVEDRRMKNVGASSNSTGITFSIRNPGVLPRKVAVISYEPGASGNSTSIAILPPLVGCKSFTFPVGTKIYLADDAQVNTVMSGKRIDADKPFLVVKATDSGKSFPVK